MSNILEVKNLCKSYPSFRLEDVSFSLAAGRITGFIGRNGAGKTTTLKSILNLLHRDSGDISFWGMPLEESEQAIKLRLGFVSGGIDCYPAKKLGAITAVTRAFYPNWDDAAYRDYLQRFALDENKTPAELSAGMRVKYALTLALSHNAELLILDEPTSGLDPVSREDLLDVFLTLCDRGVTILFSTHITSDLDKCADDILYIQRGKIAAQGTREDFVAAYKIASYQPEALTPAQEKLLIGARRAKTGCTALVKSEDAAKSGLACAEADLESVMVHLEKEADEQ